MKAKFVQKKDDMLVGTASVRNARQATVINQDEQGNRIYFNKDAEESIKTMSVFKDGVPLNVLVAFDIATDDTTIRATNEQMALGNGW